MPNGTARVRCVESCRDDIALGSFAAWPRAWHGTRRAVHRANIVRDMVFEKPQIPQLSMLVTGAVVYRHTGAR